MNASSSFYYPCPSHTNRYPRYGLEVIFPGLAIAPRDIPTVLGQSLDGGLKADEQLSYHARRVHLLCRQHHDYTDDIHNRP